MKLTKRILFLLVAAVVGVSAVQLPVMAQTTITRPGKSKPDNQGTAKRNPSQNKRNAKPNAGNAASSLNGYIKKNNNSSSSSVSGSATSLDYNSVWGLFIHPLGYTGDLRYADYTMFKSYLNGRYDYTITEYDDGDRRFHNFNWQTTLNNVKLEVNFISFDYYLGVWYRVLNNGKSASTNASNLAAGLKKAGYSQSENPSSNEYIVYSFEAPNNEHIYIQVKDGEANMFCIMDRYATDPAPSSASTPANSIFYNGQTMPVNLTNLTNLFYRPLGYSSNIGYINKNQYESYLNQNFTFSTSGDADNYFFEDINWQTTLNGLTLTVWFVNFDHGTQYVAYYVKGSGTQYQIGQKALDAFRSAGFDISSSSSDNGIGVAKYGDLVVSCNKSGDDVILIASFSGSSSSASSSSSSSSSGSIFYNGQTMPATATNMSNLFYRPLGYSSDIRYVSSSQYESYVKQHFKYSTSGDADNYFFEDINWRTTVNGVNLTVWFVNFDNGKPYVSYYVKGSGTNAQNASKILSAFRQAGFTVTESTTDSSYGSAQYNGLHVSCNKSGDDVILIAVLYK